MTFEEYLAHKKIDSKAFKEAEKSLWLEFNDHFNQQHPKSFTSQKLFLINGIRRKYPFTEVEQSIINPERKVSRPVMKKRIREDEVDVKTTQQKPKPVIKSKPVIKKSGEEKNDSPKKPKPVMKRPKMK